MLLIQKKLESRTKEYSLFQRKHLIIYLMYMGILPAYMFVYHICEPLCGC